MMFFLEGSGPTALGVTGSGFGAVGLGGWGVELDIFDNNACGDQDGNHAAIDDLLSCSGTQPTPISVSPDLYDNTQPGGGIGDIGDGQWRTAVVHMSGGTMTVSIQGVAVPNLQSVPLVGFVTGTSYWFGFGAGTGASASSQDIRNVSITFPSTRCL
jgi:hypothetical protein